jgi:hypothetical protein
MIRFLTTPRFDLLDALAFLIVPPLSLMACAAWVVS